MQTYFIKLVLSPSEFEEDIFKVLVKSNFTFEKKL